MIQHEQFCIQTTSNKSQKGAVPIDPTKSTVDRTPQEIGLDQ